MRIRLDITYDGTDFFGWQVQKDKRTAAGVLETAIKNVLKAEVTLKGAARTDRGVHAELQVAHFDVPATHIPPKNIAAALNLCLPPDIKVTKSSEVDDDFHARLSSTGKIYNYKILISETPLPLFRRTHYVVRPPFDIDKAKECLLYIEGSHNFTSFCYADKKDNQEKIRTITSAKLIENGNEIIFELAGNGFLHNMVRIIVGTVIKIAKNKNLAPNTMQQILLAQNRQKAASTAPAEALHLKEVVY